jgi:hypothetical protein
MKKKEKQSEDLTVKAAGKNKRNNLRITEEEKIPLLGFIGFIDLFSLICGALVVIFSIIGIFDQASMFLAVGLVFHFIQKKLFSLYAQKTRISVHKLATYLSLCVGPIILISAKIIMVKPESVLILIPALIAFLAGAVNLGREKTRIQIALFAAVLLIVFILFTNTLISDLIVSIIFTVLAISLFF